MLRILQIILLFATFLGGIAFHSKGDAMEQVPITNVHKALVQESQWLNTERPLEAEDLRGRVMLVDFWTFCCINCIHVIPDLQALEKEFGHNLTVVGVHSAKFLNERDTENIRQAILRYGITHPVVNDSAFHIWQSFGVRAWPTLVLINPLGKIEAVYSGEGHRAELESKIRSLIKQYANVLNTAPLPLALEKDKTPESVLKYPGKLAYAPDSVFGEMLFVSDSGHHQIVGLTLEGKEVVRIGTGSAGNHDGSFSDAMFNTPQGLLYQDNTLYVADTENHLLRQIDLKSRTVSTLAGTGVQGYNRTAHNAPALKTPLASPWDLAFYPDHSHISIAMAGTHQLWTYDLSKKTVTVSAGNGNETIIDGRYPDNSLSQPSGVSVSGDKLYFVDSETSSLRMLEGDNVTTLIGTGLFDFGYKEGKQGEARMQHPIGVFADGDEIYVADSYNHSIRRYDIARHYLYNEVGQGKRGMQDGALNHALFNEPNDIIKIKDKFYIADTNNHAIRVLDPAKGMVSTLPVTPPDVSASYSFSDGLPNIRPVKQAAIAFNDHASVHFALPDGWKFNAEAPSWLALFEMQGDKPALVKGYNLTGFKKKQLALPSLESGKAYHLQGTFYYCQSTKDSLCLIQSVDSDLSEVKQDVNSEVAIDFLLPAQ